MVHAEHSGQILAIAGALFSMLKQCPFLEFSRSFCRACFRCGVCDCAVSALGMDTYEALHTRREWIVSKPRSADPFNALRCVPNRVPWTSNVYMCPHTCHQAPVSFADVCTRKRSALEREGLPSGHNEEDGAHAEPLSSLIA